MAQLAPSSLGTVGTDIASTSATHSAATRCSAAPWAALGSSDTLRSPRAWQQLPVTAVMTNEIQRKQTSPEQHTIRASHLLHQPLHWSGKGSRCFLTHKRQPQLVGYLAWPLNWEDQGTFPHTDIFPKLDPVLVS